MGKIITAFGRLKLLLQLTRGNLRRSSISIIGLAISVSLIAAFVIYLEIDKTNYYLEILERPEFDNYPFRYCIWDEEILSHADSNYIIGAKEVLEQKINESNLKGILIPHPFFPTIEDTYYQYFMNQSDRVKLQGITIDDSVLTDCIEGSTLPNSTDEVILYNPLNQTINIGEKLNITIRYYTSPESDVRKKYNYTLTISGVITSDSLNSNSPLKNLGFSAEDPTFITDIANYLSILQNIDSEVKLLATSTYTFESTITFLYGINFTAINERNVVSIVHNLYSYVEFTSWGFYLEDYYIHSYATTYYTLGGKINEYNNLFLGFMIFSVPVFIITLFLINFSLGIINEKREKGLSLFKIRGLSSSFIFLILTLETLLVSLMASIIGIIIGIPFSMLMMMTKGFLVFDTDLIPNRVIISLDNLYLIFLLGFLIALLSHFRTIIRLARSGVSELDQEASKKKKRAQGKFRGNLDIFLLTQGILGTIFLTLIMNILPKANIGTMEGFMIFLPVILILVVFSPISLLVGFVFAFNRFMLPILSHLGKFLWEKDRRLIAVATRNLAINSRNTKRTTLLITCTISFLMILSIVPNSILLHLRHTEYYHNGSDVQIIIRPSKFNLSKLSEFSSQLDDTPGIDTTLVSRLEYHFYEGGGEWKEFEILGIERNFVDVAFWKKNYDDKSLDHFVTLLHSSSQKYPVIIDSVSSRLENLKISDTYTVNSDSNRVEVSIEEMTDYWPGLIFRGSTDDRFLITTRPLLQNLTVAIGFGITVLDNEVWCKILPGYELDEVVPKIQNITADFGGSYIRVTLKTLGFDVESRSGKFFWIIVNFNYLTALGVTLFVITLFTITRISSQATELGLSRALGMKYRQIFILMFFEPLLLFLISGIPGGIFGTLLIMSFANFGAPLFNYGPPLTLSIDIFSIILIYGSVLLIIVLSGFITSFMAIRANISQILKVE
ncbi:MAG: FtsX-like permease family protein [Promethearchaeota archaeon]